MGNTNSYRTDFAVWLAPPVKEPGDCWSVRQTGSRVSHLGRAWCRISILWWVLPEIRTFTVIEIASTTATHFDPHLCAHESL